MRPKSLKHTLLLTVAILIIISGIIISQIVTHRYSASLLKNAAARAENIAHKLALDAADKILINDLVALQKLLDDQIASDPTVAYLFIIKGDRILTHTFTDGVPVNLLHANSTVDTETGHLEKIISERGERYIDIAWPIFSGQAGTLRFGLSEEPYQKEVTKLWLQMSLMTLGIMVLALLAGHFFINRQTRPLLALAAAAEKINEGNLEARVNVKGRAEISKLATSFNGMLSRLKEYTHRLETSNRKLEEKNRELDRTHHQLRTSFAISQEISALPSLEDVSAYLIEKFRSAVECQHMALLIISSAKDELFVLSNEGKKILDGESFDAVLKTLQRLEGMEFFTRSPFTSVPLSENFQSARQLAVFPFYFQDEILGTMIVACPGNCRCVTKELDVIELIMNQTAGAIKRAAIQEEEIRDLRSRVAHTEKFSGIVGKDPKMQVIYKLIEDVAPTDATVLIQGESGTGKELVARAIHRRSTRRNNPFVVINCAAYPLTLIESELFGHEKGSFTGAIRRKAGRFEQAHDGTVFLDEIGEIPQTVQIKLLRVLQSHKFERLGGEQTLDVNVRILAATNKNLLNEVKNGNFREDLFYRLNVIPIYMPQLRKRRNDIPLLASYFLKEFAAKQKKEVRDFTSESMRLLLNYPWPGNVRELENSIEHSIVLAKCGRIEPTDLPDQILDTLSNAQSSSLKTIHGNEIQLLKEVLDECNWNKTVAATRLGISRSTLYEKLKKYRITRPTIH
ncbi:MAG: sigma 54-interacting transcriptional regulator [Deltaproteobacteria bacterium]|nr:sigma 54-interacting transcriptional regulator [Deltaproteobacteria bacterium]